MGNSKNLNLINELRNFVAQHFAPKIAVGFSGGLDSVALTHALFLLARELNFEILAIHIHHGISKNADFWADFSKKFCVDRGISFVFEKVKLTDFAENTARAARFSAFQKLAHNRPLFLAQHADDQMETMLFKIARGGGLKAVCGIQKIKKIQGLTIFRPWISTPRAEILEFAKAENLEWVNDESNADTAYARNFLRHEVVAPLKKRFGAVEKHFAHTAEIAAESLELLNDLAQMDFARAALSQNALSVAQIKTLPPARLKNLLRFILENHGESLPPSSQFNEFCRQILESAPQKSPRLELKKFQFFVQNGKLFFQKSTVNGDFF